MTRREALADAERDVVIVGGGMAGGIARTSLAGVGPRGEAISPQAPRRARRSRPAVALPGTVPVRWCGALRERETLGSCTWCALSSWYLSTGGSRAPRQGARPQLYDRSPRTTASIPRASALSAEPGPASRSKGCVGPATTHDLSSPSACAWNASAGRRGAWVTNCAKGEIMPPDGRPAAPCAILHGGSPALASSSMRRPWVISSARLSSDHAAHRAGDQEDSLSSRASPSASIARPTTG
jgi:hypothetical protein